VAGDTCAAPINVTGGGRFTGTTVGAGADYSGSCGGTTGRDVVFRYTLTEAADVYINTFNSSFDTLVYLRSTCGGGTDIACNDDAQGTLRSEIRLLDQAAGTYYVILDAWGSGTGDYALDIYFSSPSSLGGDACGDPTWIDVATATELSGNTCPWYWFNARDDTNACRRGSGGLDFVYAFLVAAPTTVTFETCGEATWDTILDVRRVCSDGSTGSTVQCNDDACSLQSRVTASLERGVYYLWVDGYSESTCGSYVINVNP
jgi:hypothetical protein